MPRANRRAWASLVMSVAIIANLCLGYVGRCAAETSPALPLNETLVVQAIEDAVASLEKLQHRRTAAIVIENISWESEAASCKSSWSVIVKYWLDYAKAEDVPNIKGMLKYVEEVKAEAPETFMDWALAFIRDKSREYIEAIAFQAEHQYLIEAVAALDDTQTALVPPISLYYLLPAGKMNHEEYSATFPSDQVLERAGYEEIKANSPLSAREKQETSSGTANRSNEQIPEQSPGPQSRDTPGKKAVASHPNVGVRLWKPPEGDTVYILSGVIVLVAAIALAVLNQRSKKSR